MVKQSATSESRRRAARDAWIALPHGGRDSIRLRVQCGRSHHVATVYDTADGQVVVTLLRARSHGSRDRVDKPHGDHTVPQWTDFLASDSPYVDDSLPAWCDCGHRTLSRTAVLTWISAHERKVVIE